MASPAIRNFMKQQGFADEPSSLCDMHFAGLYFQPRIVGSLIVVAIVLNVAGYMDGCERQLILGDGAFLRAFGRALVERDCAEPQSIREFYNRVIAAPRGRAPLIPAPGPRRFAQAIAAAFTLIVGVALMQGWNVTAFDIRGVSRGGVLDVALREILPRRLHFSFVARAGFAREFHTSLGPIVEPKAPPSQIEDGAPEKSKSKSKSIARAAMRWRSIFGHQP